MTDKNKEISRNLVPGIYSAIAHFVDPLMPFLYSSTKYSCALSIGWNPVYENSEKTVEVFLIHSFDDKDFYGENLIVELKSFIRAEALFSTFNDLILAI